MPKDQKEFNYRIYATLTLTIDTDCPDLSGIMVRFGSGSRSVQAIGDLASDLVEKTGFGEVVDWGVRYEYQK